MPTSVKDIVFEFTKDMYHLFGKDMSRAVIYGSYARADYSKESDIDVMILVKISEAEIRDHTDDAADYESDQHTGMDIRHMAELDGRLFRASDRTAGNIFQKGCFHEEKKNDLSFHSHHNFCRIPALCGCRRPEADSA